MSRKSSMAFEKVLQYIQGVCHSRIFLLALVFTCLVMLEFSFNFMIHFNTTSGISSFLRSFIPKERSRKYGRPPRLVTGRLFQEHESGNRLPVCPVIPKTLEGPRVVDKAVYSYRQIEAMNAELRPGGRWWPQDCTARHHVAIIVPYRDRPSHLKTFITNMHHFLQRQELDYGIFIVELVSSVKFNRAMLFNIGYAESIKQHNYSCFIFHDVDLIPEDDRNLYTCPEMPRHMSVAIDKLEYKLPYTQIFGGVSALTRDQFIQVNGFSNKYFGWGGEDDDMYNRIHSENFNILRYSSNVARYKMLSHAKDVPNPGRLRLLEESNKRYKVEGLNSLSYTVVKLELRKLYTWILVDVNETKIMQENNVIKKQSER